MSVYRTIIPLYCFRHHVLMLDGRVPSWKRAVAVRNLSFYHFLTLCLDLNRKFKFTDSLYSTLNLPVSEELTAFTLCPISGIAP